LTVIGLFGVYCLYFLLRARPKFDSITAMPSSDGPAPSLTEPNLTPPDATAAGQDIPPAAAMSMNAGGSDDAMAQALHPSRFAAPDRLARPASMPATATSQAADPVDEALRLERARQFAMSMCIDLQGRIWIGCEATQPDDGTGGVQCFDPSKPPLESVTRYTTSDGLGDNYAYAIACDHLGRIWVGHLNHGVSVFNGDKWQNYDVVAGLSRPGTLAGPLGERVFHIAVNPRDGDVWIATNCGLSRYSQAKDSWTYYTRADGLPSEQANSMAFDSDGNIYIATQCDGVAMADFGDNYTNWRSVTGPDDEPTTPTGIGLPSNMANDILVAKDGTVYAATTAGVAWSLDRGAHWQYVRGRDYADKIKRSPQGPPAGWTPKPGAMLSEDYTTSLAENADGNLLMGHRAAAGDLCSPRIQKVVSTYTPQYVTSFVALPNTAASLSATYGGGLAVNAGGHPAEITPAASPAPSQAPAAFPAGASVLSEEELKSLARRIQSIPQSPLTAAYLGEDWATQGNWVGHYGRQAAILCGASSPGDHELIHDRSNYTYKPQLLSTTSDKPRSWIQTLATEDIRSLHDPEIGTRRIAAWDDHGESYPASRDGPGLGVVIGIPQGLHRVSAYFLNDNGHSKQPGHRDYYVELQSRLPDDSWHTEAHARVCNFYGGTYEQFAVQGPGSFRLAIHKGNSFNVMCSGVFADLLVDGSSLLDDTPLLWMANVRVGPFPLHFHLLPEDSPLSVTSTALAAVANSGPVGASLWRNADIHVYRAAVSQNAPEKLLAVWKWNLSIWGDPDRIEFNQEMAAGWSTMQQWNPVLRNKQMRPNSPGTN
jgi:sugar lactone lactonase YvrE